MRFAEIALLAMPFAVFVAWRLMAPTSGPPRVLVIAVTATVAIMAILLLVLWYEDAAPPGTLYVPARQENGRIVPSQVEPGAPSHVDPGAPVRDMPGVAGAVPPPGAPHK